MAGRLQSHQIAKAFNITADSAHQLVLEAVTCGKRMDVDVSAAVVDSAGRLLAFLRAERSPFHSDSIAMDKAYTAASFGVATPELAEAVSANAILQAGINGRPRLVLFGGGLPIVLGDLLVGGIGVSGGSEEQDELAARAALALLAGEPLP